MALFDFKCLKCGHEFEYELPAGKKTMPKCLECGHPKTQKLLSAPSVIFKGKGFYKTDNRDACECCDNHTCPAKQAQKK